MAQCTPGADPVVALKVRRIIADSIGVAYERIHPSTRFTDDFGTD
jgi:lambda repressor-like predicted transcriptional regulator